MHGRHDETSANFLYGAFQRSARFGGRFFVKRFGAAETLYFCSRRPVTAMSRWSVSSRTLPVACSSKLNAALTGELGRVAIRVLPFLQRLFVICLRRRQVRRGRLGRGRAAADVLTFASRLRQSSESRRGPDPRRWESPAGDITFLVERRHFNPKCIHLPRWFILDQQNVEMQTPMGLTPAGPGFGASR